jgi:conjugative transfer signal peptidase TraF
VRITSVAAVAIGILAASAFTKPVPRLIWNASASAPIGLYWVTSKPITRGDLFLATTPESMRDLAAARGYLPSDIPLVKRLAGIEGDQICAHDRAILINGRILAWRQETDSAGRPMPVWSGCRTLAHEVFLLMQDVPTSFDGRYFGPVPRASIIGKLTPLWTP